MNTFMLVYGSLLCDKPPKTYALILISSSVVADVISWGFSLVVCSDGIIHTMLGNLFGAFGVI